MNHPLSDMMMSSMGKIRDMIDVNTVIGAPIAAGDVTIIPVTKVSIGYGAGGSDFATTNYPAHRDNAFGGGAGAGSKFFRQRQREERNSGGRADRQSSV